jgi:uncharacterized protein
MEIPSYPVEFWILAAVAVIAVGIGKAGFGGGVGSLATPLLALTVPVSTAAATMLPLLVVCDAFSVWYYRTSFHKKNILELIPGAVAGITMGAFCFHAFLGDDRALKIIVGVISIVFVLFQIVKKMIYNAIRSRHPNPVEGFFMGAASGFASTVAHAGQPPVLIFLLPQQLPRDTFVGTTVIFFALTNVLKLIPYYLLNLLQIGQISTTILLLPLSYIGVRLGIYLKDFCSDVWFNRIIYSVLFLTGVQLIAGKSLANLIFR